MRAGRMRWRITLRKLVEGQSASGAVTYAPQVITTVWAEKVEEKGSSGFHEAQRVEWSAVTWRIRHLALEGTDEPTSKWEIAYGARVYEVLGQPREIGYREGWEFVTRARAEDQAA